MDKIGVREVIEIGGYMFNEHTIIMTWITMAFVIIVAALASRNVKEVPTGFFQSLVEMIVDLIQDKIKSIMGPDGLYLTHYFLSLFVYLMIANWQGLTPIGESPTNDLNTTLAMGVTTSLAIHYLAFKNKGLKHIKHFFEPFAPFVVVNIIEELARPCTLAFRLFGNILAGEVLIIIMLALVPWFANWIPSTIWVCFSIFVGVIQAFIFTVLSITYIAPSIKK